MKQKSLRSVLALLLALLMAASMPAAVFAAAESDAPSVDHRRTMAEWNEILNTVSYEAYCERYADIPAASAAVTVDATKYVSDGTTDTGVCVLSGVGGLAGDSLYTSASGKVTWEVNVPADGMYCMDLVCYPGDAKSEVEKSTSVERILYINGKVPFSEARSISITKSWAPVYTDGGFLSDIGNNELRPDNESAVSWMTYSVKDSAGYTKTPLCFYFKQGSNTVSLEATREPMSLSSIVLHPARTVMTYAEYLTAHKGVPNGADTVMLEAERPTRQSDESIYPLTDRTSAITSPQDPTAQKLNYIGGSENCKTVGQWVEYDFTVESEGMYTILTRSKQNDLSGMFASRAVLIDGELPFAECTELRFDYSKDWKVVPLTDGGEDAGEDGFLFYLAPGKHTLRLEVSLGQFSEVIRRVESSLNTINDCYLDIMKLTGADPDEYRDYGFSRVMPNTIKLMLTESKNLYEVSDMITNLCGEKGSQTATLDKVAFLLHRMGSDEDEIAANLENLKTYIGTLGTWLNGVRSQPVRMDYIQIQSPEAKKPRANASFWESLKFEMKSFAASFTTDYSVMGALPTGDEDAVDSKIEVWLTEGRDQAKILKNLVSSEFTPNTGVGADVKLVAAGTLLPSVLSGQGPDVFMGMAGSDVINYAIRNAVMPLNGYEGFETAMAQFNEATTTPVTLYGTTYGMPQHASFYMMFVRVDILADLGLEVPKTWDDVLSMLPVLQANNMSIGLNREYDIFLYQLGGDRFADDGLRCGLDSNIALDAFETYTRFYTDYSFPFKFDGPNRFRTGEMPILFADYSTTYNQLTVFATEISGLWEMVPLPGTARPDGTVCHNAVNTVNAAVMLHGCADEDAAWKYIRWFCGKDAQAAYGNDLVTTIGQGAKYNTANKDALLEMPWTTSELTALTDQFENLSAVTNYPGSYIFARYMNFAVLAVVNSGKDPVTTLQSYVTTINKEITRKREEFDLPTIDAGETYEPGSEPYEEMQVWLAANGR